MEHAVFLERLAKLTTTFTPVVDAAYKAHTYRFLDLSVTNTVLAEVDTTSAEAIQVYIKTFLAKTGGQVAYGGYLEKRNIYDRSIYFNNDNPDLKRNIHLGLDVWCGAGTAILAALEGIIHSFKDNRNYGDYGPCIVLKHQFEDLVFYTLYGHLSRESINNLSVGQKVKAGALIAHLGEPSENGDYSPHLHFQIIKDIEHYRGDYPGVTTHNNLPFYRENCPDPQLLLKIN
ncbi:peptidoglycan DD-metalloendopeptidase family protein [Leeuwenhoekiella polynyae]|uniref:Peptidase M23-like protein n=1 Tax=Leeuwenhoekiella polynyae TaxID=1550906 RepID=A0A4Q0NYY8_9FLAO|nr:peptidoglycan DD-metalloendopeptidase family protein [Leeuwenhoekiella polynyae]RXG17071.1 peptidase M23-like protein [Leeuwenhoekiella polynyae]